jgi:hypothetical protein
VEARMLTNVFAKSDEHISKQKLIEEKNIN